MNLPRSLFLPARAGFIAFFLMSSAYCILAYVPFTFREIVQEHIVPWVALFAAWHPWLYWVALSLGAVTLAEDLRAGRARGAAAALLAVLATGGLALAVHPVLAGLAGNAGSAMWAFLFLLPVPLVAAIDLAGGGRAIEWREPGPAEDRRLFAASLGTGLVAPLLYAAIFQGLFAGEHDAALGAAQRAAATLASVLSHLLLFMGIFLVLLLLRGLSGLTKRPALFEFRAGAIVLAVLVAGVLHGLVLPAISFGGAIAAVYAAAFGLTKGIALAGLARRTCAPDEGRVASGLELLLAPLNPARGLGRAAALLWLACVGAAAAFVTSATAVFDWNHLVQKMSVLVVWTLIFAALLTVGRSGRGIEAGASRHLSPRSLDAGLTGTEASNERGASSAARSSMGPGSRWSLERLGVPAMVGFAVLALILWRVEPAAAKLLGRALGGPALDTCAAADRYAAYEGSYRTIHDFLAPRAEAKDDDDFFAFLQRNTNIQRDVEIKPVDVSLVADLGPTPGSRPNIFIVVIDSLRADYLSPYNPKVGFTPAIDRFAKQCTVFPNAYTHYGATGLSEPSIWVGGMLVHRQYVTPFYPMNALWKLVRAENYLPLISVDSILRTIVEPDPSIVDIDKGVANQDYRLCASLDSLREKLVAVSPGARPIFAYTQPQDIHVSVLTKEGAGVPPGESYPGFYAPYASRVRRMDGCFGAFLEDLRARGLYENSIIVLTSDHGDSLGEEGRWGHAYTLFPEIIRVPLLVRLPESMRGEWSADQREVVFTTDITPTLYAILGHAPTLRSALFGRPLFARAPGRLPPRDGDDFLLASSYGPVYGILGGGGRFLYVVDAINYEDWFFDLAEDPAGTRSRVTADVRREYRKKIRDAIVAIHAFYRTPLVN